jgi:hypothetical protein
MIKQADKSTGRGAESRSGFADTAAVGDPGKIA